MASDRQIEANRQNAQKCTGPRTPEGKATSSQNAFKTGIDAKSEVMHCESRSEYDELIADFQTRFSPATPEESSFVDALIRYEWLSRRYMAVEASVWNRALGDTEDLGRGFVHNSQTLTRADKLLNVARRGFDTTLKALRVSQALRAAEPETPADPPSQGDPQTAQPEIGVAPESLNPKLVSFLQIPLPPAGIPVLASFPPVNPAGDLQEQEEIPPIAA